MNTLVIQDMLADPEWADVLTDEDKRALTPLFWMHILPYGEVRLTTGSRLQLARPAPQEPVPSRSPPRPDALAAPRRTGLLADQQGTSAAFGAVHAEWGTVFAHLPASDADVAGKRCGRPGHAMHGRLLAGHLSPDSPLVNGTPARGTRRPCRCAVRERGAPRPGTRGAGAGDRDPLATADQARNRAGGQAAARAMEAV